MFGPPGKQGICKGFGKRNTLSGNAFVHEWSKFRYGVFEEFGYPGDPLYPMFYYKTTWSENGQQNVLTPNFCTDKAFQGSMQ